MDSRLFLPGMDSVGASKNQNETEIQMEDLRCIAFLEVSFSGKSGSPQSEEKSKKMLHKLPSRFSLSRTTCGLVEGAAQAEPEKASHWKF